jgi:AAHS family 4-hydroxybenzoate transporter-like MFS transporter
MVGGSILASGLGLPTAFAIVAIPVVIAGLSVFAKARLSPQPSHQAGAIASAQLLALEETAAQT